MAVLLLTNFEGARPISNEGTLQPVGDRALAGQTIYRDLVFCFAKSEFKRGGHGVTSLPG